jgi:ABC-type sugar transport system ATPase subunit
MKNITKKLSNNINLSNINLSISEGEIVSILGPTGSGKTSILRLLMGLDTPDSGLISGIDLKSTTLVFQEPMLLPFINVRKNILLGVNKIVDATNDHLDKVVKLLRLEKIIDNPTLNLSGGERQLVSLARSLMIRPKILLLDEPFSNIDAPFKEELFPAFNKYLEDEGISTIFVTHDRDEAFYFSKRIFLIRDGKIIQDGIPSDVYRNPTDFWVAGLLGECNVLDSSVAKKLLGVTPKSEKYLVRPEELIFRSEEPHNGVLTDVKFHGFCSDLFFKIEEDVIIKIITLKKQKFKIGNGYKLVMREESL